MPETGATAIARATSGRLSHTPGPSGAPAATAHVHPEASLETEDGVEVSPPDDSDGRIVLKPGMTYRIRVRLHPVAQDGIIIRGQMRFWLVCEGIAQRLTQDEHVVRASDVAESPLELEFVLVVPGDAPVGSGALRLRYRQGLTTDSKLLANVELKGAYYAAPTGFQEAVKVQLAPLPDRSLAIIHVAAAGEGLRVTAYHPSVDKLSAPLPQPAISLADVADEKPSLEVYQSVDEYCRKDAGELIGWLIGVLAGAPDDLTIVIAEHTDSRVPWEMLVLEKGKPLLGERVMITRWTTVGQYATSRFLDPASETIHQGRVLAFVDDKDLGHIEKETRQLDECASVPCDSLSELQKKLKTFPSDVGLVFLACHGVFAKDAKHEVELKDVKNPSRSVKPLNLAGLPTPERPPAMVINACHSARLVRTGYGISGFPEFFLGTFARSFLGTIGAVDDEAAGAIGAQLVKEARSPGGIRIAEFLLKIRKQAAEDFKTDNDAWKYVSYFMYVFYGSPRDRLEIEPRLPAIVRI